MNYPILELSIIDHIPRIEYHPDKETNRVLVTGENLIDIINDLAKEIGLHAEADKSKKENVNYLLSLCYQGDERVLEVLPNKRFDKTFGMREFLFPELKKAQETQSPMKKYGDVANEAVIQELQRNRNIDLLASILETLYNMLIARTIEVATEMGVGSIAINDQDGYLRLQEKMASELSKIDITLQGV